MSGGESTGRAQETARATTFAPRGALALIARELTDPPARGASAWARTTAGVVAFLLSLQFVTGLLLAFYYVPAAESAHATVAFIEKVVPSGSWVRALHHHGSTWLPAALALHLAQMLRRGAYRHRPVGWLAAVLLLALVTANAAVGYTLPWDARAFYSARVASGLAGGLPLAGGAARRWLVGGDELSTLTLSRFNALHALVVPLLILAVATARLFVFRERAAGDETRGEAPGEVHGETHGEAAGPDWLRAQLARNAVAVGVVFAALAFYAARFPAPLGPAAGDAEAGYLPRPGAQFLWLFQLLKYLPPPAASLAALLVPALLLGALALLPFARLSKLESNAGSPRRKAVALVFLLGTLLVGGLTAVAYLEDARDPLVRERQARQARQEEEFRRAPFVPLPADAGRAGGAAGRDEAGQGISGGQQLPAGLAAAAPPPAAYTRHCAKCHGAGGEGRSVNPPLSGVSARPRRTVEDIVAILNDPASYGLESRMPKFSSKLTEEEKQAVAAWVVSLKEPTFTPAGP